LVLGISKILLIKLNMQAFRVSGLLTWHKAGLDKFLLHPKNEGKTSNYSP